MKINIDQDKCLRCGMCTGIAMDVFEFDDDGNITVIEENIKGNEENIDDAKNSCPVGAIQVEEE